jgi:hypothetical protein
VNSIVWVFNLNYWDPSGGLAWYPDSAYVDLVSPNSYLRGWNDATVYDALLTTGKPIIYAEVGVNSPQSSGSGDYTTVLATIKAKYPKSSPSSCGVRAGRCRCRLQGGESSFMNDPAIVTLSDVPASVTTKRQSG